LSWILLLSFDNLNPSIANNGDVARNILHSYLVLTPCGAIWSLDHWLSRRKTSDVPTVLVYPWWLRLLFLQLVVIYFFNGVYKLLGKPWREGSALYYVLAEPFMTRVSYLQFQIPYPLLVIGTYTVLVWELSFPLLVLFRWTRLAALWMGV